MDRASRFPAHVSANSSDELLRALGQRIRTGDVAAFEQLFRAMHAPLCEVVDAYVRSQDVAEDIVQDLFLTIWITRSELAWKESPRGYLFAAARNRAFHHLRHAALVRRRAAESATDPRLTGTGSTAPLADHLLETAEVGSRIRRVVDALPPRTRLAAVLRWDHDMAHKDIAVAMGISVKGVEKLLGIAKSRLRQELGEQLDRGMPID
jgi:RNA polymerase sigma-70 factor (ECF subfamily)